MVNKRFGGRFRFESNTGFGSSAAAQGNRLLNKDGSFNVRRTGMGLFERFNVYHDLINMNTTKFGLIVVATYTVINILFAGAYLWVGIDEIEGVTGKTPIDQFWDAFFFSSQTLTTVGYGRTSPIGFHANWIAVIECLIGLMMFALITGLLYGRFSRPRARLVHSQNALIAPYKDGMNALMLRLANGRRNQLIECEAEIMMSFIEQESGIRRFLFLDLEFKKVTGLALSWTIVHPITSESPLYALTASELEAMDAEFILIFKAYDDAYSQVVHSRFSYMYHELIWGARFVPMFHSSSNKSATVLEMNKVGIYNEAPLFSPVQIAENT